ncbi:MAG TPA: zinc-binding dehydrogenase, partial [Dehalococcoidia bacterium]|nr:zinc-binding dehydrogenase [Dehalococcoidia bacterium]
LEKGPGLLDRRVLVTAASGGVGYFACQLARLGGARVVGVVRRAERRQAALDAGAHEVVLESDLERPGRDFGPFDVAVESVGGQTLPLVLRLLTPRGVCVTLGATAGADVAFNIREFFALGGVTLYGFHLIQDMTVLGNPIGPDLGRLAALVADGRLRTPVEIEAPWTDLAAQARRLLDRDLTGKAVLWVGGGH